MIELHFDASGKNEFEVFIPSTETTPGKKPGWEFFGWMSADKFGVWKFRSTDDSISVKLCRNAEVAKHRLAATLSVLRRQVQTQKERARDG